MLRSLYAGITGMKVNQTKLDVTGNNIANVGTTAFKNSRVRFQDMLSQNMGEATGPGRNTGGVNGRQIGLGVQVAGIDTVVSQGMMQPTSRNLDAAVDGTGYFVVARGPLPESNDRGIEVDPSQHTMSGGDLTVNFTRDGAFTLDYEGNLLTSDGFRVMGYSVYDKAYADTKSINYGEGSVSVNFVDSDSAEGIAADSTLVPLRIPDSVSVLSYPNISNSENFNFTGSGNDANITSPTINTIGENADGEEEAQNFVGPIDTKIVIKYDAESSSYCIYDKNGNLVLDDTDAPISLGDTDTTIYIDKNGVISTTLPSIDLVGGIDYTTINLNTEDLSLIDENHSEYSWSFTFGSEKKIRSYSFEKDGVIKAVLDDGSVAALGQIAMASFKNPEGLKKLGKNLYERTANSGESIIRSGVGTTTNDNSDGYGDILQGVLEMSNVDLAEQFTDMIVTTRAFQAAGKMITTGDEILQDIINLKR